MPRLPHASQIQRATGLLTEILRRERPADVLLAECFRAHREMGGRDRAQVSDLVYRVLRHRRRYAAQLGDDPQRWIRAALVEVFAADADTLARMGEADPAGLSAALATPVEAWEVQHNLPPWLAEEWPALLPEAEWAAAAAALQQPGTADFRVNRLRADPEAVLADLATRGVEAERCRWAPDGLRLTKRLPQTDPLLREGRLIPQDEGSQWLVACLPLAPGQHVLDYCAGAGGKSLALAAQLQGSGQVTATDIDPARLARLPPRARLAGAEIETLALPLAAERTFDGVLVDAPCSGSGTLRRAPERGLDTPDLAALQALQIEVLSAAAAQVAPGGWLVYATCSLSQRENEAVVEAFAATHPDFRPEALRLPEGGSAPRLRLWPHRHQTDGFFAAGFRRPA